MHGLANLLLWIVTYLLIMVVHPFFEILLVGLLIYSFTNFLSISACYPLVDKYLVQPITAMQAEETTPEPIEQSTDSNEK